MEILDTRKMQCCVPFCKTTSMNVMTTAKGTTFHEVPSELYLRTAWLRALGIQEHHLPDPAVVCSQHFLDDDFYETNSCVRQIRSNAIPSTVQMCMICLDTGSKLLLMTKHNLLQEAYDQLTGLSVSKLFQLCRGGNLKQTLCVLCAQRLINFSRFRDLCLRAHSLMTDLVEQHELITLQHKEVMNKAAKHSKFNLTQTTLSANHCDLYINHTDEEEQLPAEESVVVKIEDMSESIMISDRLLVKDEYKGDNYKYCVSIDDCSASIKVETHSPDDVNVKLPIKAAVSSTAVRVHVPRVQNVMKTESVTFGCTLCVEDFVEENAYNKHMSKHLQDASSDTACDASQVCEPRAAVSRSGDSLVLQNKMGSQRLSDEPPPAAGCAPAVVAPLSASVEANENPVTEESAEKQESDKLYKRHSEPGIKPYYSCNICDFRGKYESAVIRHVAGHTGLKPYSCDLCSFRGSRKYNLATHMITHTGDKRHTCVMCDYKCARSSDLVRHIRTHTAVKPICCVLCNYRCAQNSDLLKHMRTHSGEKPCSCEFCDYKCAGNSDLLKHMRTHAGVKPYSCDVCNYKCARKSYLFKHKIIHTGEKPYTCETCGYKCSRKFNLLKHTKTHTAKKR